MNRVLAVDPGLRGCGAALFIDGRLARAAYLKNPVKKGGGPLAWKSMARAVWRWAKVPAMLVVETPQVYQGAQQKGDPNDLIELSATNGALASYATKGVSYAPRQWKGQVPKPKRRDEPYIIEMRVRGRLFDEEKKTLPENSGPKWDAIDAVGIGLHFLGRL